MFQFPGLALKPYVFRFQYPHVTIRSAASACTEATIRIVEGGFPHSEIRGSKLIRSSPRLIAAYHVLHRLSAPRHPPNALKALDRSHDRCPQHSSCKTRSERPLCLPNRPDLTTRPGSRERAARVQLSNLFPLHDDKQLHLSSP